MRLVSDFVGHVRRAKLLRPGDRVLVACSGGADSTALVHLVARSARRLDLAHVVVAHLDHALRVDSAEDAAFVAKLARRLDLPLVAERRPVERRRGESPEAAARRVRYAFLEDAAKAVRADVIVTAHHMDDQAETVLLRVLRGTGPRGLAGIRPLRRLRVDSTIRLARPLLIFRRERLRDWLARWRETWREDPTNVAGNVRAKLRTYAIPVLADCVARDPVPLLARLADRMRQAEAARESKRPRVDRSTRGRKSSRG